MRYFLKYDNDVEEEVTKSEWVKAERAAGFNNTMGEPLEPGTAGFGGYVGNGQRVKGRIEQLSERC